MPEKEPSGRVTYPSFKQYGDVLPLEANAAIKEGFKKVADPQQEEELKGE